ncbi:dynein heavy chain domain-containing protein 1-like, partial [Mantella aurantiaca]
MFMLQDMQYYEGHMMPDAVFSALSRSVTASDFSSSHIRPASTAAASLCDWLRGLQQYCAVLRSLEESNNTLSRAEAQELDLAGKMAERRIQQERLRERGEETLLRLHNASKDREYLRSQETRCQERRSLTLEYEERVRDHMTAWRDALQTLEIRLQSVPAESLLVSASISYLGGLPWRRCVALLEKWRRLCDGEDVPLDADDVRDALARCGHKGVTLLLEALGVPAERMGWHRRRLPVSMETQSRAALLRAACRFSDTPMLIIDPDNMAERCLAAVLGADDTDSSEDSAGRRLNVMDSSDPELTQKLSTAARG